ncbi:MAG TPA: ATP synthase F1 subunit delta, partial [Longimicrobium sp.]|nr:ATP synthase F1 subunit delta [Longimicrobium sp.]
PRGRRGPARRLAGGSLTPMRSEIIARNYAETLLELARRQGGASVEAYLGSLDALAALLEGDPRVREFLETPRIGAEDKKAALTAALGGRVPDLFLRFVLVVVDKRRQGLFPEIAAAYRGLVDERMGRVRVAVSISHAPDPALQDEIRRGLEARLGKAVIPTFTVEPELLGGVVVRMGDQILDGSLQSRAAQLRRHLLAVELPPLAAAGS